MRPGVLGGAVDEAEALVAAALAGDQGSWAALYDLLAPDVHRFLLGLGALGRGEVEEAVQETFVRLVRDLGRWDRERPLRPFALGVARHVALDALRRGRARDAVARALQARGGPAAEPPGARLARAEEAEQVRAALSALEPELRGLLVLRHANQLSMRELAASCECSLPTLRERLRKAARRFAVELQRRGVLPAGWSAEGPP